MGVERQQGRAYQLSLFKGEEGAVHHGAGGEGGTGTAAYEEQQRPTASERKRALPEALMEEVVEPRNLNRACQRVKANKGAPGVDGMTVDDLGGWLVEHREELMASLLEGSYQPQPVRGVEIPKPGGGVRQLGIPTVVDRLAQQAILQVLEPLLDPTFSERSYGFRSGRNAHQALRQAQEYVAEGREIVVDLDLVLPWKDRPGEPRHLDVPPGPESRRQTLAPDCPPFLGSGDDAERGVHGAAGRDSARGAAIAAPVQSATG